MNKTQLRFEIAHLAHVEGRSQMEIARFLRIKQPTVSRYLKFSSYEEFRAYNGLRNVKKSEVKSSLVPKFLARMWS